MQNNERLSSGQTDETQGCSSGWDDPALLWFFFGITTVYDFKLTERGMVSLFHLKRHC